MLVNYVTIFYNLSAFITYRSDALVTQMHTNDNKKQN